MLFSVKHEFTIRTGIQMVSHAEFKDFETDAYEAFLVYQRQVSKLSEKECEEYIACLDREVEKKGKKIETEKNGKKKDVHLDDTSVCFVYGRDAYLVYRGLTNGLNIKLTKKGLVYNGFLVTGDDYNKNIIEIEKQKMQELITFFGEDDELPSID
ncbi:MAG: hypothetical protein HFI85_05810 [Clostridia bacterium]|jgi:hypothetical protein|nr:hypothetical protein [Clostridia bacterium]